MHEHGGNVRKYPGVLDFSANLNFNGMPEAVRQAALQSVFQSTVYPDPEYLYLKEKIAERENLCATQVLCGNGAAELIYAICHHLRPKKGLLAVPGFYEYEQALRCVDCEIIYHRLQEAEGYLLTERILKQLTDEIEIVFLTNPGNPTGQRIEEKLLLQISEICEQKKIYLVVDESFLDFLEPLENPGMAEYLATKEYLLILRSFTKMYAMAGLRVGYLLGEETFIGKVRNQLQPWNLSTPAMEAAIACLSETGFAQKTREQLRILRPKLKNDLTQVGLTVFGGEANYLFFKGPETLWEDLLARKILIRDCSNFVGLTKGYYRTAVRSEKENEQLIAEIKHCL